LLFSYSLQLHSKGDGFLSARKRIARACDKEGRGGGKKALIAASCCKGGPDHCGHAKGAPSRSLDNKGEIWTAHMENIKKKRSGPVCGKSKGKGATSTELKNQGRGKKEGAPRKSWAGLRQKKKKRRDTRIFQLSTLYATSQEKGGALSAHKKKCLHEAGHPSGRKKRRRRNQSPRKI